ncbi:MAG: hypothetical protein KatS3mg102_1582 [Planctomycetota bacterium]|nr:MAG: hypothetical protein KatS3mg102_1582 [Planctomycetota bacterium]
MRRLVLGGTAAAQLELEPAPMLLGSAYVELVQQPEGPSEVLVAIEPPPPAGVRWVVQAVPGLGPDTDGEVLGFDARGCARVQLGPHRRRTLILTPVPADPARHDPDTLTGRSHAATLIVRRAEPG